MSNYPPSITPRKKRSAVWRYFSKITLRENLCKLCGNVVTAARYSTGGMIYHLRSRHYPEFCEIMDILRLKAGSQSFNGPVRYNRSQLVVTPPPQKQSKHDGNAGKSKFQVRKRTASVTNCDELDDEEEIDGVSDMDDEADENAERHANSFDSDEPNASVSVGGINGMNINCDDEQDKCDVINANDDEIDADADVDPLCGAVPYSIRGQNQWHSSSSNGHGHGHDDDSRCNTDTITQLRIDDDDAQFAQSGNEMSDFEAADADWRQRGRSNHGAATKRRRVANKFGSNLSKRGGRTRTLALRSRSSGKSIAHQEEVINDTPVLNGSQDESRTVIRELTDDELRRLAPLCTKTASTSKAAPVTFTSSSIVKFDSLKRFYAAQSQSPYPQSHPQLATSKVAVPTTVRNVKSLTAAAAAAAGSQEPFILVENRDTAKSVVPSNCIQRITVLGSTGADANAGHHSNSASNEEAGSKSRLVLTVFPDLSVKASTERSVLPPVNMIESRTSSNSPPPHPQSCISKSDKNGRSNNVNVNDSQSQSQFNVGHFRLPRSATQNSVANSTGARKRKGTPSYLRAPLPPVSSSPSLSPPELAVMEEPIKIEPREPEDDADQLPSSDEDDGSPSFCTCRSKKIFGYMIVCSSCLNWYHVECAGFTRSSVASVKRYVCSTCSDRDPSQTTAFVRTARRATARECDAD